MAHNTLPYPQPSGLLSRNHRLILRMQIKPILIRFESHKPRTILKRLHIRLRLYFGLTSLRSILHLASHGRPPRHTAISTSCAATPGVRLGLIIAASPRLSASSHKIHFQIPTQISYLDIGTDLDLKSTLSVLIEAEARANVMVELDGVLRQLGDLAEIMKFSCAGKLENETRYN